jgi:hypothetical protein
MKALQKHLISASVARLGSACIAGFLFASIVTGCSGSTAGAYDETPALAGTYTGSYTGHDSGSLTMTIDANGAVSLAAHSYLWGDFAGNGTLRGDIATATGTGGGAGVTFQFDGQFALDSTAKGSGTWRSSNGASGTWSVSRH